MTSFCAPLLQALLKEIKDDISESNQWDSNAFTFSPILWLESPNRKYIESALGISIMDKEAPLVTFLNEIQGCMGNFFRTNEPSPILSKYLLVICQLIRIITNDQSSAAIEDELTGILKLNFLSHTTTNPVTERVVRSVSSIIRLVSQNKMNAIKKCDPSIESNHIEPLQYLQIISCVANSTEHFKTSMVGIAGIIKTVPSDQRIKFADKLYSFLAHFYTKNKEAHVELLKEDIPQAQTILDSLLGWKFSYDTEILPVFGALISYCHDSLAQIQQSSQPTKKKPHPFVHVMKLMGDMKKYKKPQRTACAFGLLELARASILISEDNTSFAPIKEFLNNKLEKSITYILSDNKKKKSRLFGKLLTDFLPKYASVEYAMNNFEREKCQTFQYIWSRALDNDVQGLNLIKLIKLIMVGYPAKQENVPDFFPKTIYHMFDQSLNAMCDDEKSDEKSHAAIINLIINHFGKTPKDFYKYTTLVAKGIKTNPVQVPVAIESACKIYDSTTLMRTFSDMLCYYINNSNEDSNALVCIYRNFLIPSEDMLNLLLEKAENPSDIQKLINSIAISFRTHIETGFHIGSPLLPAIPYIIHRFLVWADYLFENAMNYEGELDDAFVNSITAILLELRSVSNDQILTCAEKMFNKILDKYSKPKYYIYPYNDVPEDDETFISLMKTVYGIWLSNINAVIVAEVKDRKIPLPQFTKKKFIYPHSRTRVAQISTLLNKYIHLFKDNSYDGQPIQSYYFKFCYNYIFNPTTIDVEFTNSFKLLDKRSRKKFLDESVSFIGQKFHQSSFDSPSYWTNSFNLMSAILDGADITDKELELIEQISYYFVGVLQLGPFYKEDQAKDKTLLIIRPLCLFLKKLYSHPIKNIPRRMNTLMVLIETGIRNKQDEIVKNITYCLPLIVKDLCFSKNEFLPHLNDLTSLQSETSQIAFVVKVLDGFNHQLSTPESVTAIQLTLNNILKANSYIGWPIYVNHARTSSPLFKGLLIESLTTMLGGNYRVNRNIRSNTNEPQDLMNHMMNTKDTSSATITLEDQDPFYRILVDNNFSLFTDPPFYSISFIRAAINCSMTYLVHDKIFDLMVDSYILTKPMLSGDNAHSIFFTGWFKQMTVGWEMMNFMGFARPSSLDLFVNNLDIPIKFVYYLHLFADRVQNPDLVMELMIECFIKPLISSPFSYGLPLKLSDVNKEEFVSQLIVYPEFIELITSIIQAEPYYPIFETDSSSFIQDMECVLFYLTNSSSSMEAQEIREFMPIYELKEPKPTEMQNLNSTKWLQKVGSGKNDHVYFYIKPTLLHSDELVTNSQKAQNIVYYLSLNLMKNDNQVILIIQADEIPNSLVDMIPDIVNNIPKEVSKRIENIYLLNISLEVIEKFENIKIDKLKSKIRLVDSVEEIFSPDDRITLPVDSYGHEHEKRLYVNIEYEGENSRLYVCDNCFVITTKTSLYGQNCIGSIVLNPNNISEAKIQDGGVMRFDCDKSQIKIKIQDQNAKVTQQLILNMYKTMKMRMSLEYTIVSAGLETQISPSPRVQMIAFSLYLLASPPSFLDVYALQMFEVAVNNKAITSCTISTTKSQMNLSHFFSEVVHTGLLDDVVSYLGNYITQDDIAVVQNLLPLFVMFMNTSTNRCLLTKFTRFIYPLSKKPEALSILERFFWSNISAKVALEYAIPVIFSYDFDSTITRRTLHSLIRKNCVVMGELIIRHYLDGTIRRRAFGSYISPEKIFAAIPNLPFNAPEFIEPHVPQLLFCTIVGAIHRKKDVVDNIIAFLECSIRVLESIHPELDLNREKQKLISLLQNPRLLSALDVINASYQLAGAISESVLEEYQKMMTQSQIGDNPDIFYIKSAAYLDKYGDDQKYAERLIRLMSNVDVADDFVCLKLGLLFQSISKCIDTFDTKSQVPYFLLWPPLLGTCHTNMVLRISSMHLIEQVIKFSLKYGRFVNINGLETTQYITYTLLNGVHFFEEATNIHFSYNFSFAFVETLSYALQDIESRQEAVNVIKFCIESLSEFPNLAVFFVLAHVAYSNEDPNWALKVIHPAFQSIPDLIYDKFKTRDPQEHYMILSFLNDVFGERYCSHRVEIISDVLVVGATKYPSRFNSIRKIIFEKATKMLDNETNPLIVEKLSNVAAAFLAISSPSTDAGQRELRKIKVQKCDESSLITFIGTCANGVEKTIDMGL